MVLNIYLVGLLNLKKSARIIMLCHLVAFLLNVGLNFLLIPVYSATGAGYATLISYGLLWFFLSLANINVIYTAFKEKVHTLCFVLLGILLVVTCREQGIPRYYFWFLVVWNCTLIVWFELKYKILQYIAEESGLLSKLKQILARKSTK